ncbi:type II secretion system protein GspL [Rhizobacter sp. LjRoot28]|jgi:general secretion pathway protein L|uniref:type II secretion system protein GspL n=1 Tax=Rhizobacter sp. LjRoot28 TaxID=3342309 RepID=UPI003ECF8D98
MSTLVVQIPPRLRLQGHSADAGDSEARAATEYRYALSPDGLVLGAQGQCAASLLPKASIVVAVLSDADVSWHRITLPKAPAARLQMALVGVLEEALLEDPESVHLAVAPMASVGQSTWIAATDRAWLAGELAYLEKAQVFVDRVVPASWPDDPPTGHFSETATAGGDAGGSANLSLSWAHPEGVVLISLKGTLGRSLLPNPLPENARFSATPGAAAAAEKWLGAPVAVMNDAQRLLLSARSLWNLRQFTLARKNRGSRALRDVWRQFLRPDWRPLRYGLVALVVVQLVGLNLWAASQRSMINSKRAAMGQVLRAAHPQIQGVLDAPLQMRRETDTLRAAAGRPGESDLEPLLSAAASAWPPDRPPVENLRYEPGRLTLSAQGWAPEQIAQFTDQLRPSGWQVESTNGLLTLSRTTAGLAP